MNIDRFRNNLIDSRNFWQESAAHERKQASLSKVCALGADVISLSGIAVAFNYRQVGFGIAAIGITGDVLFRRLASEEQRDALSCELTVLQRQAEFDQLGDYTKSFFD